jgi:hypothetical protein
MNVMNPEDAVPKSRVVLSIYCKGLQNKDSLSKSDPFCVVQEKAPNGLWRDVGRTEVACCQRTQHTVLSKNTTCCQRTQRAVKEHNTQNDVAFRDSEVNL